MGSSSYKALLSLSALSSLLCAAPLRLWELGRDPVGLAIYAAAARNVSLGWDRFLFPSVYSDGWLLVDKPPVFFWLLALSLSFFGDSLAALRLPAALGGIAGVALLCVAVGTRYGSLAGTLAALVLAINPEAVNFSRGLFLEAPTNAVAICSIALFGVALKRGSASYSAVAGIAAGVGFSLKLWQAFLPLPGMLIWGLLEEGLHPRERVRLAVAFTLALVCASLWWPLAVLLLAGDRPVMNAANIADLLLGWNLFSRFDQQSFFGGGIISTGPLWYLDPPVAHLFGISAVVALPGMVAAAWRTVRLRDGQTAMWLLWLLGGLLAYSLARTRLPQYLDALTPPVAALTGIGVHTCLLPTCPRWLRLLVLLLAAGGSWYAGRVLAEAGGWAGDLWAASVATEALLGLALITFLFGVVGELRASASPRWLRGVALARAAVIAALALIPLALTLRDLNQPDQSYTGAIGYDRTADRRTPVDERSLARRAAGALISELAVMTEAERKQVGEYFRANATGTLVVTDGVNSAAHLLYEGVPAVALINEYQGTPLMTPQELAALAEEGKLRYFVTTRALGGVAPGLLAWVISHTTNVTHESGIRAPGVQVWRYQAAK